MHAHPGDELVVVAWHSEGSHRYAKILEVQSQDGAPPYLVRWLDTNCTGLVYPTRDAFVCNAADTVERHLDTREPAGVSETRRPR